MVSILMRIIPAGASVDYVTHFLNVQKENLIYAKHGYSTYIAQPILARKTAV